MNLIRIPAKVTKIIDSDTCEVEFSFKTRVRLIDCWSPERNTEEGKLAKKFLESQLVSGDKVDLEIPLNSSLFVSSLFSFGRILGRIFKNGADISEVMCSNGFAKPKK